MKKLHLITESEWSDRMIALDESTVLYMDMISCLQKSALRKQFKKLDSISTRYRLVCLPVSDFDKHEKLSIPKANISKSYASSTDIAALTSFDILSESAELARACQYNNRGFLTVVRYFAEYETIEHASLYRLTNH